MELQLFMGRNQVGIHFVELGRMARKVVKRSNARKTSKYPSWKMKRMLQCESENERNAMVLLDVCSWVRSFRPQPCIIHYLMDGQERSHYPDLLVETRAGAEFWEIKTSKEAAKPETSKRTEALSEQLPAYGYRYRVMLAEDLRTNPRLDNANQIKKLGSADISPLEREHIRMLFQQFETLPWGMFQINPANPRMIQHVCRMVLEGELFVDISQPLTVKTPVSWVSNPTKQGGASWESLISRKAQ